MKDHGFRCFECNKRANHAHHIIPKSLGGERTIPLCEKCHGKIHALDFKNHGELTKLGIKKARENGGNHGRPPVPLDMESVLFLRKEGVSFRDIAKTFSVSHETVARKLRRYVAKKNKR